MSENRDSHDSKSELRRRAEEVLETRGLRRGMPPALGEMTEDQLLDLLHDIQVHQIELEMQNEELRRTQEELAAARDRYFDLFDLAPVGYFLLDENGAIVEVNLAGAELVGVQRSALKGVNLIHYVYEIDRDRFFLLFQQVYRTREPSEGELRFLKPGESFWYGHLTCALVKEPDDEAGMLRVVLTDITALKVSESNLKSYALRLEELNKDLESFTYIASHDLQEPLSKILRFGELVKTHPSAQADEDLKDYVERMQKAAARMQSLIADLLKYSRVSNQKPDYETVDLGAIAADVVDDLETQIKRNGAQVEVGELPVICAEPTLMRQLFQNLIGNALKFHQPEKAAVVRVEGKLLTAETAEVRVADQGIGFDELDLKKIFRPFERLHGRSQYEGTGIGLAICQKIVERHSGTITARSKPGEGSTFIVTLPVKQR